MQLNPSEISDLIKKKIENFDVKIEAHTEGTVVSVSWKFQHFTLHCFG